MDSLPLQCSAQSLGPANQLFTLLIQALITAHCELAPESMWPTDYGVTALEKGNLSAK